MRSRLLAAAVAVAAAAALTTAIVGAAGPANAATCNGYVGLTFDDGPSNDHTPAILNALRQNGLRATMFNEGQYAASYPAQVRAQVTAGMWVGNHSYTHPHLTQQSQAQIDSEISRTQQAIANAGGGTPKLFRPPYGETNGTLQSVESKYGLKEIIWDVDSQDWNNASVDAIVAANGRLTNGQIILMHEWPANTLAAIPRIAQTLASKNLCSGMISPQTGRAVAPDGATNPPPTTPGGGTSQPPNSPPPAGGGACSASYAITSSWQGGFQASVTVTAGNAALSRWTVKWTFANGQTITQLWNGTLSASGSAITVTNASYNGNVPAGGTTSFGFTGNWNGTNAVPSLTCSV
ncbi:polysaccharide deacetylase family protein [Dactylosporangium sp. NPDC051541]|uniref:polysaccharide deacetylase family protein n=1 Tax=Dactylosporangium sp. NPDC051541 TaxID=3363977 RepID=UPI003789F4BA